MPTNKVLVRTSEEVMNDYTPVYQPLYSLFLGKSQSYSEQVGTVSFKRLEAKGDIRAREITPKDTEIKQISVGESKKSFKKYFLGNQYQQSSLQDVSEIEEVIKQVLDEHQKQADGLLMGTSVNNGLFTSTDSNYTAKTISTPTSISDTYGLVVEALDEANKVAGQKIVLLYGKAKGHMRTLFATQPISLIKVLSDAYPQVTFIDVPDEAAPAGENGFIVVNKDQVKLHYTVLPEVKAQGVNEEMMYQWTNFLMGSMMLEVLVKGALIKQPLTLS